MTRVSTAFVLSGAASLASVQAGMLQALEEAGVRPDLLVGTSAGAFNAAWAAGHPVGELSQLQGIWLGLRRQDVFPSKAAMVVGGILGRRNHLFGSDGLERLVRKPRPRVGQAESLAFHGRHASVQSEREIAPPRSGQRAV